MCIRDRGIAASEISSWQAGDLILGGSLGAGGSSIEVAANSVTIGSGAEVQANQVLIVAGQSIDLQPGAAVLSSSAGASGVAPTSQPLSLIHISFSTASELVSASFLRVPSTPH